jgi:hypothetical protein
VFVGMKYTSITIDPILYALSSVFGDENLHPNFYCCHYSVLML